MFRILLVRTRFEELHARTHLLTCACETIDRKKIVANGFFVFGPCMGRLNNITSRIVVQHLPTDLRALLYFEFIIWFLFQNDKNMLISYLIIYFFL